MEPDDEGRTDRGSQEPSEVESPEPETPGTEPPEVEPSSQEALGPGQFYRLAWIVYLILAVAGLLWIGSRLGTIPLSLFLRWETVALDLGVGLAGGGFLIGAWVVMRRLLPAARRLEAEMRAMLGPLEAGEIGALALLSGLAEELFFRGAMQGALGWPIATLAFTVLHTGPGRAFRVWTLFAAVAGLVLAGLVVWRETLLPAIVAHILVNWVNLTQLNRTSESADEDGGLL